MSAGSRASPTALVAVDLDQTVVFSERSAGQAGPSVVVEHQPRR